MGENFPQGICLMIKSYGVLNHPYWIVMQWIVMGILMNCSMGNGYLQYISNTCKFQDKIFQNRCSLKKYNSFWFSAIAPHLLVES